MSSILGEIKKEEEEQKVSSSKNRVCILCEEASAKFCVKDMPHICYCEECAQEEFGSLDYLEKLG
jgi:hypothetical protein